MEKKNEHYFYVLECVDGSFYGGYTIDLDRRVAQHNQGLGAKYTRARSPVTLLHAELYATKTEAMQAEYAFKKLVRTKKEKYLKEVGVKYATSKKFQ